MQVIAIGPQGGKIVGYQNGDLSRPIYAGTAAAAALEISAPDGSPAQRAELYGVKAAVAPTDSGAVQFSWPARASAGARAWLQSLGGKSALPAGARAARGGKRRFLTVPRAWAEGTMKVGPDALLAKAGFTSVDKSDLPVWGVKSWLASSRHPVSTPHGDGVLLGQEVSVHSGGESVNGMLRVRLGDGSEVSVKKALVKPKSNVPQGAWTDPAVQVWRNEAVAQQIDSVLADPVSNSGGKSALGAFQAVAAAGHATFVTGGLVRDAVIGKKGADIDATTTATQVEFAKAAGGAGYNVAWTTKTGLVELGHDKKGIDEGKIQCRPFAVSWGGSKTRCRGADAADDAALRDFAMNALSYDPINRVVIDPTGTGVADAIEKKLSIPAPKTRWGEWADAQPLAFLRYYKFRARGYTPKDDATRQFIITTMAQKIEDGTATYHHWSEAKGTAFRDAVIADMGDAWWKKHMAKHWSA